MQFRSLIVIALFAFVMLGFFGQSMINFDEFFFVLCTIGFLSVESFSVTGGEFSRKFGGSSSSNSEWGNSYKSGPGGRTEEGFNRGGSKSDNYDET